MTTVTIPGLPAGTTIDPAAPFESVESGVSVRYTLTQIAAAVLALGGSTETIQDVVAAMVGASNGVRVTYDDAANTLTFDSQETVNAQTGTSYTFVTGDRGKLVTFSNAAAIAGTLPQAGSTGFPAGWWCDVQNRGAGTETTTPATSTIDGAASLALITGQGTRLVSDGTNWFTQRGVDSAAAGGTELKYLTLTSDTSSQADSDPGNGLMKWNNATQASATVLFMDNQTLDAVSLTTFYGNLVAGGFIYLQQSDDSTKWQLWKVTTVTSASGYYKFTVTLQASGGSITTGKTVYSLFQNGSSGTTLGSITGFGTGVATALAINVGTSGAPVVFNGAGGTPSSLTLTNSTGLPISGSVANTVTALSISSGVVNIDCSLGDYFTLTLTANVTSITFSNLPGSGKGASKWVEIVQGSGPYTVAFPSSFKWAGGTLGVVSTVNATVDELAITTVNNGTAWKATLAKAFA